MISSLIGRNICTIQKIGTQSQLFYKVIQCQSGKSGVFAVNLTCWGPSGFRAIQCPMLIKWAAATDGPQAKNSKIIPKTCNRQLSTERVSKISRPYEVNTNVTNNVILYKYENNRFYKLFSIFGFTQLIGWFVIAYYIYSSYCTHLFSKKNWMNHIGEYPLSFGLFVGSALLGILSYGLIHFLITRSVKYVILCKGGKQFIIVTYHPIKQVFAMTLPLEAVSANIGRKQATSVTPLKIKGKPFFYLMDVRGTITNPELFDFTAGIKR